MARGLRSQYVDQLLLNVNVVDVADHDLWRLLYLDLIIV